MTKCTQIHMIIVLSHIRSTKTLKNESKLPGFFWADSEERYNEARQKKCKSGLAPVWHCHSTRSSEVIFISQIEPGYQISSELGAVILCELVASAARPVVLERRISRVDTMYGRKHLSNPPCKSKFSVVDFARRPPTKNGST